MIGGGIAVAALALVVWVVSGARGRDDGLPARMTVADPVVDLSAGFDHASVVEEQPDRPVHEGGVRPHPPTDEDWTYRRAIVAPPRSVVRFRVPAPPGAVLRFGVGVETAGRRDDDLAGVRFAVEGGGHHAYARTVNPAATRYHRPRFQQDRALV